MSKKFIYIGNDGFETEGLAYETSDYTAAGGAGNEDKPVILNGSGLIADSMINQSGIDHGSISGLADDDHTQYIRVDGTRAFTGDQSMGSNKITNLAAPSASTDATNKAYVDAVATGLRVHGNVEVASTANIAGSESAGVFTSTSDLVALNTVDGVALSLNDRILLKDQTNAAQNGIFTVTTLADGSGQSLVLTRAEDMDNSPIGEIYNGEYIPKVLSGTVNAGIPFVISSVGTGVDGLHTIGTDDIDFTIFTSPTQLQAGDGINFNGNTVEVDLANTDPGLFFDGNADLGILWSTAFNDARAIKASDLASNSNGLGASIIGIEDAGAYTSETDVEGAIQELYSKLTDRGVEYVVGTGGVSKGDLVYISANNTVLPYGTITAGNRAIGLALTAESAAANVVVLANDTVLSGVLSGATAGDVYYWDGSALTTTIPSTSGQYVWRVGVAKNATDLHVEVEFVKKNI